MPGCRTPIRPSAPASPADQRAVQNADKSFTDRILGTSATPDTGKPLNADAEIDNKRGSQAASRSQEKRQRRLV